jgi:hypothetical protein
VRYLTRQFAVGALRRGSGIEQFLVASSRVVYGRFVDATDMTYEA